MEFLAIISKAQTALSLLQAVKPMLGENEKYADAVADVVGKALSGAKFGADGYLVLINELDGVIEDLEAVKARGGLSGDNFRHEIGQIETRGAILDSIKDRLTGG